MKLETRITDRKPMAQAIGELLHEEVRYLYMPTCAYSIGPVTLNRDGSILCDDDEALAKLIPFLREKGLLPEEEEMTGETAVDPEEEMAGETAVDLEEEMAGETAVDPEEEAAEQTEDEAGEATEVESDEKTESPIDIVHLHLPIADSAPAQVMNLVKMLYARQELINAMIHGSELFIDEEMPSLLRDTTPDSIEKISELIEDEAHLNMVRGIRIADGYFSVDLPPCNDATTAQHHFRLISEIAVKAMSAQHVSGKKVSPSEGEMKYYCNIFLNQLGFGGKEHKDLRRALMSHLSGYAAFKNTDRMNDFKARLAEQRRERRQHEED